jgi:2-amino-4-hydroxy-6-hydroxymethyldihydropteridine diphosphokinase
MNLKEWRPFYLEIVREFGFDRAQDERSAQLLSHLLAVKTGYNSALEKLSRLVKGCDVLVCGKAPILIRDIKSGKIEGQETIIAADGATSVLLSQGVIPHIVVSDLDGNISDLKRANAMCAIMVVHAHGDNINAIEAYVPSLSAVLGTAQTQPEPYLLNVGGFTDGDRAVFLAKEYGARTISAIGFDFSDISVTPRKMQKLRWAKRLLEQAEVNFK